MVSWKRAFIFFLRIFEIYIPTIAFMVMFSVFITQIFFRYVLRDPITWSYEVTVIGFIWAVWFGAIYSLHKKDHVTFSLLYDLASPKTQMVFRLIGNTVVIIALSIALYPIYDFIRFMGRSSSTVLEIPFNLIYMPMLLAFIAFILHMLYDLTCDIRKLLKKEGDYSEIIYEDQYDNYESESIPSALNVEDSVMKGRG